MMTSEIAIAVPLLGRPQRVRPLLESARDATPEPHTIWLIVTHGDQQVINESLALADEFSARVVQMAPQAVGDYAKKINRVFNLSVEPFIFTAADDLKFYDGWWPAARAMFDDPKIGVVGTNDLAPTNRSRAGDHSTHFAIRRTYVQQHGLIDGAAGVFYEGYHHEYVDDEAVGTAKHRGAWAYASNSIVEHLHPHWGKAPLDRSYRQQNRRMVLSRRLFSQRRRMWT